MLNYNLHQHSLFSDGKEQAEAYVKQALELGFSAMGFSEHSPLPFPNPFSIAAEELDNYVATIKQLQKKYKGKLDIFRALEMDYIPEMSTDFNCWKQRCLTDYLIGSIHLVKPGDTDELWFTDGPDFRIYDEGIQKLFGGDMRKAVKTFYHQTNQMIESQDFDIVGHVDKVKMHNQNRFFSEDDKWYQDLVDETLELIRQNNLIVEVNTRGLYKKRSDSLFPDNRTLQRVRDFNIPVIITSDAHHSSEIGNLFNYAEQRLLDFGFHEVMFFEKGKWNKIPIAAGC